MKYAVFADAENVNAETFINAIDMLKGRNKYITVCTVYGKLSAISQKWKELIETGIAGLSIRFEGVPAGKNMADMIIVRDITRTIYTTDITGYMIVTNDADFIPIFSELSMNNKNVIIASTSQINNIDRLPINMGNIEAWTFHSNISDTEYQQDINKPCKQRRLKVHRLITIKIFDEVFEIPISKDAYVSDVGNYLGKRQISYDGLGKLSKIITNSGYKVKKNRIVFENC